MKNSLLFVAASVFLFSCATDEQFAANQLENKKLISLNAEINQVPVTRVNDNGFCDGDVMAVYIVDYEGDTPGVLKSDRNRADNLRHTFDEAAYKWSSEREVYFRDENTPVDIYGYYPVGSPEDVNRYAFTVQANQSTEGMNGIMGGYEASDFLWGKVAKVAPTENKIKLPFYHRMSSAKVELVEGEGFDEGEWSSLEKSVVVKNVKRESIIDLATGTVTATGAIEATGTVPYRADNAFRAIVVPQTVAANTELFALTVGMVPYTFTKEESFEYVSGKLHKFTIKVDKKALTGEYTFTLVSEAITAWENDNVSHDATMREYIIVNSTAGGLKEAIIAAGKDYTKLQNLKITGEINASDFTFMNSEMSQLENLNMKEVLIEKTDDYIVSHRDFRCEFEDVRCIPSRAFFQNKKLARVVFPDSLDIIGGDAFYQSGLTGSLYIPEGVKAIGSSAFRSNKSLDGTLFLPYSLTIIGDMAFENCSFRCELSLPSDLEYIGEYAFYYNEFYGGLTIPHKLKKIYLRTFEHCGFTGDLILPDNIEEVESNAFIHCEFDGILVLSDNLKVIGQYAFMSSRSFRGSLVLPSQIRSIGEGAFMSNDFSGDLILPESLESIGVKAFQYNQFSGVVEIPKNVVTIGASAFQNCDKLEGVVLHSEMEYIADNAFINCYMLNSIVSKSEIPPRLGSGVFDGVAKDNFTLEVPEGSVAQYAMTSGWSDFKRIAAHHELVCRPAFAIALNNESTRTLVLDAEGDWEVESMPDWCSLSQTSGSKKTELTLTINELAAGSAARTGEIVFKLKDEEYTHKCAVSQYDYQYAENQVITLQSATKGNAGGIDLVFLGDGYDAQDISSGLYMQDMQMQVENFFDVHPYKQYREYFNVYTAIALSPESGIGTLNTIKYSKFETTYTSGSGLKCNNDAVFQYVLDMNTKVTEDNLNQALVVLVPNCSDYGGICYMWGDGSAIAIAPKSNLAYPMDTRGVLQHEAGGHGFGKLGDEYIYVNGFVDACSCTNEHADALNSAKANGWYDNLSLTGKMHEVPWSHLIFDERYSDLVDIYEGGFFHTRGVFRSEYNSCMNNNVPYFSTISRESIVKRIKRYAGEEYSFEEFVANDSRAVGTTSISANVKSQQEQYNQIPLRITSQNPPVIYEGSPLKKK